MKQTRLWRHRNHAVPIAYHKAIDLATAMECRCYRGGDGRTRMNVLKYRVRDLCALVLIIALGVGLVFLNKITFIYVMK